jgi:hypothetical protein
MKGFDLLGNKERNMGNTGYFFLSKSIAKAFGPGFQSKQFLGLFTL